ncbi:MAG: DUF1826 domain-containing protein [Stappiaceae bacterium]
MNQVSSDYHQAHTTPRQPTRRKQQARDVLIGRQADILGNVTAPGVAAAIWLRRMDASFESWTQGFSAENLPTLRTTVPISYAETAVLTACEGAKIPITPERQMLAGDVGALALIFGKIMNTVHVRIRLDVSDDVMCPKFHVDNVPARLLCTYKGPGTEYVPDNHVTDTKRIRTMRIGSAGLFRGAKWKSNERTGLLHRSPAVEPGTGPRLLLVIDTGG